MKRLKDHMVYIFVFLLIGLLCTNLGEAWRLSSSGFPGSRLARLIYTVPIAFQDPLPSLIPFDILTGLISALIFAFIVLLRRKSSKKFRHDVEYGSARWGNSKDIKPFMDPKFEDNMILTKTEMLTMNSRPKNPALARNKNVLVVGGSGSGKTRFFIKPNLLQCNSKKYPVSFVVTDPKMYDVRGRKKSGIKILT